MISLVVDTACEVSIAALAKDGKVFAMRELKGGFLHSRHIFSAINELCHDNQIQPQNLTYVTAGSGPGSYTGIRVGVAALKGISCACSIPLIGVSTLMGFVPEQGVIGSFCAAIDAKIGGIYVLKGFFDGTIASYQMEPKLVSLQEFEKEMMTVQYIITPDWKPIAARISCNEQSLAIVEKPISAQAMCNQAHTVYLQKKYSEDGQIQVLYLRKTQAEIERGVSTS